MFDHHKIQLYHKTLMEDGVVVIPQSVNHQSISEMKLAVNEFIARNTTIFNKHLDSDGHYPRIINMHLAFPRLLDLFSENTIALGVQDAFFKNKSSVYTSLYYERGSAQPIHRDTPYFCTRPEYNYLGVWVALEDANSENGCLEVIRKGHLIPEFDREKIALEHFPTLDEVPASSDILWEKYQSMVSEKCLSNGLKIEKIEAKAGDTVIWHPQLPHGGSAIKNIERTRHSLVMHVVPENTPVYHQDVFFNPRKSVPLHAGWEYGNYKNRKYAKHQFIEFGHQDPQPPSAFNN